jgi:pyrroline-5-carboxylate reductase
MTSREILPEPNSSPEPDPTVFTLPGPFWLVGCGNMAGAMLEGWLARGLDASRVTVIRRSGRPAGAGVRVLTTLPEDEVPALLMLGVKPQQLGEVAPLVAPALEPQTILVSILAGVEQASLRDLFPACRSVFRAMPNLPAALNRGVTGVYSDAEDADQKLLVERLMSLLGSVEWFDDERLLAVMTALGGSGPAFVYRFTEALAAAAEAQGLPPAQAARIALATVAGASELAALSGATMAELVDRVASAKGTTRAGLDVLDEGLPRLVREAIEAAVRRSRELAEEARSGPS